MAKAFTIIKNNVKGWAKKDLKKPIFWVILAMLLGILILGSSLREYSYASVPNPGETRDEYSFGWLGLSLISERYPISLSGISAYDDHDFQKINVDGLFDKDPNLTLFAIDKPWFDHPPGFGLITGGYAYLKGVRTFADASVIILRRPMLKIAILTTFLIFILSSRLYNVWTGLFASLLYSTIPTIVISNRLALAENGYVPLFLGSMIFAHHYLKKKQIIYWVFACILASFALLFKLSGIAIFIFLFLTIFVFAQGKKKKLIKITLISAIIPLIIFLLYGVLFDGRIFINVLMANSQRFFGAGSEIFYSVLTHPTITRHLTDGWVLMGWISLFIIFFTEWRKKSSGTILILAGLSYFIVFLLFGSESYGWYRIPFYPFIVIAAAKVIIDLLKSPNVIMVFALLLLPIGTAINKLIGVQGFQKYVFEFRLVTVSALFVVMLELIYKSEAMKFVGRVFIVLLIILSVYLSIMEVYYYSIDNWYFAT